MLLLRRDNVEVLEVSIICVSFAFFLIALALACYFLGKLSQQVKHATQISNLAALSGFSRQLPDKG